MGNQQGKRRKENIPPVQIPARSDASNTYEFQKASRTTSNVSSADEAMTPASLESEPLTSQDVRAHLPELDLKPTCSPGEANWDPLSFEAQQSGIPTLFEWEGGTAPPESVYVVGSFGGWSVAIPLSRSHSDFSTILYLPKGRHEYKFIVNGEWKVATEKPILPNGPNGAAVNYLDVVDVASTTSGSSEPPVLQRPASPPGQYEAICPPAHYLPNTYEKPPPLMPPHLKATILSKVPDPFDPTVLPVPHHVMLDHACVLSVRDAVMVMGSTRRLNNKFVTVVLYRSFPRGKQPHTITIPVVTGGRGGGGTVSAPAATGINKR